MHPHVGRGQARHVDVGHLGRTMHACRRCVSEVGVSGKEALMLQAKALLHGAIS